MSKLLTKKLISTKEAGEHSGYHPDYIARMCRTGKMEGERIGRSWFTTHDALSKFSESQESRKREIAASLTKSREIEYQHARRKTLNIVAEPAMARLIVTNEELRPSSRKPRVDGPDMRKLVVSQAVFAVAAIIALSGAHSLAASDGLVRMSDALLAVAEDAHISLTAAVISINESAIHHVSIQRTYAPASYTVPVAVSRDMTIDIQQQLQNMAKSMVIPAAPPRAGGAGAPILLAEPPPMQRIDMRHQALAFQALYAKAIYGWVDFAPQIPALSIGVIEGVGGSIELAVAQGIYHAPEAYERAVYAFVSTQNSVLDSVLVIEHGVGERLGEGLYAGSNRFALVRRGLENEALGIVGNVARITQRQTIQIGNIASAQVASVGTAALNATLEGQTSENDQDAFERMGERAMQLYEGAGDITSAIAGGIDRVLEGGLLTSLALPVERVGVFEAGIE